MLTRNDIERALPASLKTAATQQLADLVNNIATDPIVAEQVRNNFISYTSVLREGRFKTEDYVHAVMYVSFKLMGYTNREAYEKTFPQRVSNLLARGASSNIMSGYVSAYAKGKLVNLIMEQVAVPTWVLNQDLFQKAINVQAELMLNANSEKVRSDAANSLLTHLKKPDVKEFQVSVDVNDNSGITELKNTLRDLALQQQNLIEGGVSPREIAGSRLIEADAKVVD